jgi:hypothetical protein
MRQAAPRRALLARLRAPEPEARMLAQVHGAEIIALRRPTTDNVIPDVGRGGALPRAAHAPNAIPDAAQDRALPRADGWITDRPGAVVAVSVADCLPIWIWHRDGRAAGVFHSGWRGLAAGLPAHAAAAFSREFGIKAEDLEAFVGPHAGACCYQVGPEVSEQFRADSLRRSGADTFLDLGAEARSQLAEAGLRPDGVRSAPECTVCSREQFYSYRREGRVGQMLAYLWLGA